MSNTNKKNAFGNITIPVLQEHKLVSFLKKHRFLILVGVVLISFAAIAVIPTQPSVLKSQMNVSRNNVVTVPTTDSTSIPVVVSDDVESSMLMDNTSTGTVLTANNDDEALKEEQSINIPVVQDDEVVSPSIDAIVEKDLEPIHTAATNVDMDNEVVEPLTVSETTTSLEEESTLTTVAPIASVEENAKTGPGLYVVFVLAIGLSLGFYKKFGNVSE